jgi:succinyl-diaminopimelate desuccinylase
MGHNAIHAAAVALQRLASFEAATVDVDGLAYREALQVVRIEGGWPDKHNVVPDTCRIVVSRRFAPSSSPEEALSYAIALLEGADDIRVLQAQPAAAPNLANPLVADFVNGLELPVRPKLGWTDVARFASRGVPAVNFGPGDPAITHGPDEHVTRRSLEDVHGALSRFVGLA